MMTKEMFQAMRLRYPNPLREPLGGWKAAQASGHLEGYCVAGAFVTEVTNRRSAFPGPNLVAVCLGTVNPGMGEWDTLARARQIIAANDEGDFELAWKWIAHAVVEGEVEV